MKERHHDQAESAEVNITPLLDIVFILLIFFIVTTSFVKESGVEVSRPAQTTNEGREQMVVLIREDGGIWIADRQIDERAVRANIERLSASLPAESGAVVIAHSDAATGVLVGVLDQIRQAGVESISVAGA